MKQKVKDCRSEKTPSIWEVLDFQLPNTVTAVPSSGNEVRNPVHQGQDQEELGGGRGQLWRS